MSDWAAIALWIIAICFVAQTVLSFVNMLFARKSFGRLKDIRSNACKTQEHTATQKALREGRFDEALKMALDNKRIHPIDPYSIFDVGLCYYYMKDWDKARAHFQEAQRLAPAWEKDSTGPYLRAIDEQARQAK